MIYGKASVEEEVMRDASGDRVAWCNAMKVASHFSDNGWDGLKEALRILSMKSKYFESK